MVAGFLLNQESKVIESKRCPFVISSNEFYQTNAFLWGWIVMRIFLPPALADGKDVILVDGKCYERVGPSNINPDTFAVTDSYSNCNDCENPGSSSGSGSGDPTGACCIPIGFELYDCFDNGEYNQQTCLAAGGQWFTGDNCEQLDINCPQSSIG